MTDTKTPGDQTSVDKTSADKPLSVSPPKTLTLKRGPEQSTVSQRFSHGRSNQVVVEVKRRIGAPAPIAPKDIAPRPPANPVPAPVRPPAAPAPTPAVAAPRPASSMVLRTLSSDEQDARSRALADSRTREGEERQRALEEATARAERDERERKDREAAAARVQEEESRRRSEDDFKRRAQDEARRRAAGEDAPAPRPRTDAPRPEGGFVPRTPGGMPRPAGSGPRTFESRDGRAGSLRDSGSRPPSLDAPRPRPAGPRPPRPGDTPIVPPPDAIIPPQRTARPIGVRPATADDDEGSLKGMRRPGTVKLALAPKTPKVGADKQRGRLTIATATGDNDERTRSVAAFRRRTQRMTGNRDSGAKEKLMREVILPETITVQELANRMSERGVDVIRLLMKQGQMIKINDVLDADTAQLIAEEMGHTVRRVAESDVEEGLFDTAIEGEVLTPRPAVVTIMGHVDHGKTSLLDAIRKTNVVKGESGGITQHIGAYQVTTPSGAKVSFIDTPGHAAFSSMRARGAKVTDVVVLVVAADDGVMPQTVEAINHAKAAGVPIIVAVNKIDKPEAQPDRVRNELLRYEVQVESVGGETLEVAVSAKTGEGLDKLLDAIALQAEVLDLRANANRMAEGTVIEAKLDRGRGPVATVLVQRGTLRPGDIVVAGAEWGRVRALINDAGVQVKEAGPSLPVEVLGFNATPEAGDRVGVVESEARAREITDYRVRMKRDKQAANLAKQGKSLAEMMREMKEGAGRKEFPLVIKGDVQGSVEAIVQSLEKAGNDEVRARVLLSGVGAITESDVTLAAASGAAIIGFNVRAHKEAREVAASTGSEIRYYSIIYDLVDDIKQAMSGLLPPTLRETMLGNALMLEIFDITKVGKIAGCRVTDGVVQRGANVRLIRDGVVMHEGKLGQLKRFKEDAQEVRMGMECGMSFENYQDMRAGDIVECFRIEEIKRSL
jgi:translation initiation factor IF-2